MFRLLVETILPGSFTNQRLSWNLLSIFLAFLPTNLFTYHTNRRWVFLDGKHSQRKEFILFTSGAAISFFICQFVVFGLIHYTIVNDFVVTFSVILVSTGINFLFRKFFVFHGWHLIINSYFFAQLLLFQAFSSICYRHERTTHETSNKCHYRSYRTSGW